jgi:hypothetical protein
MRLDEILPKGCTDKIAWLVENKQYVLNVKKSAKKICDTFTLSKPPEIFKPSGEAIKALSSADRMYLGQSDEIPDKIRVRAVVNTTNYMDSHGDVHINGIWNKSLKENKYNVLLKDHKNDWENVITDEVHVFTKYMSWRELGWDAPGDTQALIYDAMIPRDDSTGMFKRYLAGKVKHHSVAMRYIKIFLAVNDPNYPEEYANWQKYSVNVLNISEAEEQGFFFAVTEAKHIEGSAVVIPSNPITPTLYVGKATHNEVEPVVAPLASVDEQVKYIIKNFNPF